MTFAVTSRRQKYLALQRYSAKIVQLHAMRRTKTQHDRIGDEEPSLFHYLKTQLRRDTKTIRKVRHSQGNNITQSQGVIEIFLTHLRRRYQPIPTNDDDFRRLKNLIQPVNPSVCAALLETPLRRRKSSPS